jgi:hypothetical protein
VAAALLVLVAGDKPGMSRADKHMRGDKRNWFQRTFGATAANWGVSHIVTETSRNIKHLFHMGKFRTHGSEGYAEHCVITEKHLAKKQTVSQSGCPFADWLAFKQLQQVASRKKGLVFALRKATAGTGLGNLAAKMAGMNRHYDVVSWDKLMKNKFTMDWQRELGDQSWTSKVGAELEGPSWEHNDHNFNTMLGQGNTLGFVAGNLKVNLPPSLPSKYRRGMFTKDGATFPAVVRFSDFGRDGFAGQLARMAVKINVPSAAAKLQFSEDFMW